MKVVKLKGPVVTAIIASLAMAGVVVAFTSNASPYVTIAQAKTSGGDNLHLAGVMQKQTFRQDVTNGHITFDLKDFEGKTITVEHIGSRPASLLDADNVVAIGALKDGRFVSHDLLVKCPSKYGEDGKPKLTAQN